jgi:DNA polymerase I-like protein with 3'-5' exonuclease and polymerase domains
MKIRPTTIDFETKRIDDRPRYPPEPVGVSIKPYGKAAKYWAWGHVSGGNNCTKEDAERALANVWNEPAPLLFHNGKFDVDVAETWMNIANTRQATDIHDTQFILFLLTPHALQLGLKPSAELHLRMPPDERNAVAEWLVANQKQLKAAGHLPANVRVTLGNSGAWISLAPGQLVAKYANGDVDRTVKLFDALYPQVVERGMLEAYRREQRLMPCLLANEREGMRCDLPALEAAEPVAEKAVADVEKWLRKQLNAPDLDFEKDRQVADVLDREGVVTEWSLTPTGLKSLNKKVLKPSHFHNQKVFTALGYRNKLTTCLQTYIRPWLETARMTDGYLHAGWNQTKNDRDAGARTGRLSSSPNFMAVAKSFEDKGDGWTHPAFIKTLPALPFMRRFILPYRAGHLWGRRDYNQQEVRILGHFEDGLLMDAYKKNPRLDVHTFVQQEIFKLLGVDLPRTPIKTLNFGLIYGQGVGSMAEKLNREVDEVKKFREAQFAALPGLKDLDKTIKQRGRAGQSIRTWGGREYFCEEPKLINGRHMTFEYKMLNYLIQGSAADCTKEATIRWHDAGLGDAKFEVQVHDEVNMSAPKKAFKREMLRLREIMMSVEFDLPMLSDAEFGPNWHDVEKLKEPQPDLSKWSN